MRFAQIHMAVAVAVALLGGVALLSQPGRARATPGEPAAETDSAAVRLAQGDQAGDNKDLESLKGTWKLDTMEWGRISVPKELAKGYKFVFAGNKLTWDAAIAVQTVMGKVTASGGKFPCDFKIDPGKKPKQIDITLHLKNRNPTLRGIYEIKGDTLKICVAGGKTGKRPTEFSAQDDGNIGYFTLARAK